MIVFRVSFVILFSLVTMLAQNGGRFAVAMAENAKLLSQYTCKQRTEIIYKGESRLVRLSQVRFDPDGGRQLTSISESGGEQKSGFGSRLVNLKRAEIREYATRLSALVERYFPVSPAKLREALPTMQLGQSPIGLSLDFKDYVKPGDKLSLVVDVASRKLVRVELNTSLDKDPFTASTRMANLPDGPTYPEQTRIDVPSKQLEIRISEFDFLKL